MNGNGQDVEVVEMPTRLRVRPIAVIVQLEIVADDGTNLHPVETRPLRVAASDWPNWHLDVALAQAQAEVDGQCS